MQDHEEVVIRKRSFLFGVGEEMQKDKSRRAETNAIYAN